MYNNTYSNADCQSCLYYDYDEETQSEECTLSLDEDEAIHMINRKTVQCPYYRNYDEYKTVRKQN